MTASPTIVNVLCADSVLAFFLFLLLPAPSAEALLRANRKKKLPTDRPDRSYVHSKPAVQSDRLTLQLALQSEGLLLQSLDPLQNIARFRRVPLKFLSKLPDIGNSVKRTATIIICAAYEMSPETGI